MKEKSTINGVLKKMSLTILNVQKLSFFEKFQTLNTAYDGEEGVYEKFLLKRGSKINARETQGKHTRATNTRGKCGNHLTRISPHIKCDKTRILGHG